ncbi:MAG: PQQ-binding-like beta-propeller repeat protein [Opitutaceae bacterium]
MLRNTSRLFVTLFSTITIGLSAAEESWTRPLPSEVTWTKLAPNGSLVVGYSNGLGVFSPSGDNLWNRDDLRDLAPFNVNPVPETPYLLINEHKSKIPPKARLQIIDYTSGETFFDSGVVPGNNLGAYPIPGRPIVLFAIDRPGGRDIQEGTFLVAFSLVDGSKVWECRLGRMGSLKLHQTETGGFMPNMDLSGHPLPLIVDDTLILTGEQIIAIDLEDGKEKWRYKLGAYDPGFKLAYARPVHADGVVYATGRNSVVALDLATGNEIWKGKAPKGLLPELEVVGDLLIGRIGGTVSNGKTYVQVKPFGAFAIERSSGKETWSWTKARDSITNLQIIPDQDLVVLADKAKLYALKISAKGKPVLAYELDLEFRRRMGSTEVAAKGLGAATGFLSGGLSGGLRGLGGGDRSDPPLDIRQVGDNLIVRGQYHLLAHNVAQRNNPWSIEFSPPGMDSFALVAMGAVTAAVAVGNAGYGYNSGSWARSAAADSTLRLNDSFQKSVAERFAASEAARDVAFFVTVEEKERSLVGIDLNTGEEIGEIPMDEKEPQFMVDNLTNRVYHFRDQKEIIAYDF